MKESDARASRRSELALAELSNLVTSMQRRFQTGRRLLSFQEYLELFATDPARHGRDAARYVRDMFDNFGTYAVKRPWGECTRYRLFDLPWEPEPPRAERGSERRAPYHGRDAALASARNMEYVWHADATDDPFA